MSEGRRRIKVGLIVYAMDRPLTGISRYTLELAQAMARMRGGPALTLLLAGGQGPLAGLPDVDSVRMPLCRLLPGLMTAGNIEIRILAGRHGLDLVHDPNGVAPLLFGASRAATVVTVHDAFPWSIPGYSSSLDNLIYRRWLPRLLPRRVDGVITDSEQSGQDIQKFLGVRPGSLRVISPGVARRFRASSHLAAAAAVDRCFGIRARYVLFVGGQTPRKNLARALQAFAAIRAGYPDLLFLVAGPISAKQLPGKASARETGAADRIIFLGPVPDADLPALYAGASAFVFPSLYEGFGLPVLEAMACGVPVVTSNISSLPEVAGHAALLVDPYDVRAIAEALRRVLSEPGLARAMRDKGVEQAAQFTWERTAEETVRLYEDILASRNHHGSGRCRSTTP